MRGTVKFEGGRELERQLERLKVGTGKGAARRALRKSAKPIAAIMEANAPRLSGDLGDSIAVTSKLSSRQASQYRNMFPDMRSAVVLHVGPGPYPQAITQEFGTYFHDPQPFVRPAWDQDHMALLDRLKVDLWEEITKTVARAVKRGTTR